VRAAVEQATARASAGVRDGLVGLGKGVHPVDLLGLTGPQHRNRIFHSNGGNHRS
jgi:hypothetical protein